LKRLLSAVAFAAISVSIPLSSQTNQPAPSAPEATLRINSRAVLVDVLVTDRNGAPVKGLKQSAFTVNEQGKPQTISFFEEHTGVPGPPKEIPKLPPNVFSNFSPYPDPPAVNLLLLDSLNTHMENQSMVHKQAIKFLRSAKPGTRMAIFTLGLGLHFVQGFTDDPSLLLAALNNKNNNEVQSSVMITSQSETNANANLVAMMNAPAPGPGGGSVANPAMTAALQDFLGKNEEGRTIDRVLLTLENMQRLATFLTGFPGRKNVIWFSESFPLVVQGNVDPHLKDEFGKTMAMLAAARVAIYPVDSRGVDTASFYQADNQLPSSTSRPYQIMGVDSAPTGQGGGNGPGAQVSGLQQQDSDRALARYTEETVAKETGGKAFVESNGFAQIIDDITSSSADFYTLSYAPTNQNMDGSYRKIDVKVGGGHYNLSYRRGYPATDAALPGSALLTRAHEVQKLAAQNPGQVDPLMPFMDLAMPQSQQILFKVLVKPLPDKPAPAATAPETQTGPLSASAPVPPTDSTATTNPAAKKALPIRYKVDFAIDLSDLTLDLDPDGTHKGGLSLSILAYDRYGNIVSRKDTQASLAIKPEVWEIYKKTGLLFSTRIDIPKGQYWLRIGLYDQSSAKVGTLELPLSAVTTVAQK
jgi:VWFA-related protein